MEKRVRRIEIIVFVILTLVVVNFITSIVGNNVRTTENEITEIEETKELPSEITREFLDKIVYNAYSDDTDPSSGHVDPPLGKRVKELDGLTILPFFS